MEVPTGKPLPMLQHKETATPPLIMQRMIKTRQIEIISIVLKVLTWIINLPTQLHDG